ncbi:protein THYLAKOID ASSEMBLY 8-like, chloroplastic [Humulus lupulus]|uniref:protein THYLAKOID ASSEMBLY 8-like, chloroplastic n=1 Tax=Humulus lupulus TaxID=3486 RepID=UPI002B40ABF4|nr:protein THYLAKOID ASSEMBLY 8-like, chloroplastic [Humulus lupulus]
MATRAFSRSKISTLVSGLFRVIHCTPIKETLLPIKSKVLAFEIDSREPICGFRLYHDGRPRGPLWRGKKLIGKEALFVILGLKRFKDDEEKLDKFIKTHVLRLLKLDLIAVLTELERQEEVTLATKVFNVVRKQDWYKADVFMYKDLIIALARSKKMDEVMQLWESMKNEDIFPDSQTYSEVIRGFLSIGSPGDAMNIYEDMKKSPDPPEELPFRILLKGLLPHPLLRNRVKQDFEELFPEKHMYDPPEEIFGAH